MAWQDEMVVMLRVMINDLGDSPTYSDSRLEQMLSLSAKYVQEEIYFAVTYTIDVSDASISPDPTITANLDTSFTNFVVLKAACLADWGTFRQKALLSGLKARCGPAILETMEHMVGFRELISQGPCAAYDALKQDYQFGNVENIRAVLSPFRGNNFDPSSLSGSRHGRY